MITGLIETEATYFKQVEKDSTNVSDLVQNMGLQAGGNILSIRRFRQIAKQHNDNNPSLRRCRPILVTTSNSNFTDNCFPQSLSLELQTSETSCSSNEIPLIASFYSTFETQTHARTHTHTHTHTHAHTLCTIMSAIIPTMHANVREAVIRAPPSYSDYWKQKNRAFD